MIYILGIITGLLISILLVVIEIYFKKELVKYAVRRVEHVVKGGGALISREPTEIEYIKDQFEEAAKEGRDVKLEDL